MGKSIKLSKVYNAPISEVWKALTDQKALSEWLMPCNFVPKVGYDFQFKTKPYPGFNGVIDCKVLELKNKELLSFSWSGGPVRKSIVTFRLTPEDDRTRLDFEHSGFEGLYNNIIAKRILSRGWKKKILAVKLPQYLSQ